MVRALTDAYLMRQVNGPTKLGILYIFNDVVQKEIMTFGGPPTRHFLQSITPLAAGLSPEIQAAHLRTLQVLKDRQIVSKTELAHFKKAIGVNRFAERQRLVELIAKENSSQQSDAEYSIYEVIDPNMNGKIMSTLQAMKAFCQDPRTADSAVMWTASLLAAAGLSLTSDDQAIANGVADAETLKTLQNALTNAARCVGLELELIQMILLDWSVSIGENTRRLRQLADYAAAT